jgi:hypothetical protein
MTRQFSAIACALFALFASLTPAVPAFAASASRLVDDRTTTSDAFQKLLAEEDFAAIEKLADRLRTQKKRAIDGLWEISLLYPAAHINSNDAVDADFESELALMQKWKAAFPASITRPVAEATILTTYAWKARRDGLASTVNDHGRTLFNERIARAKQILDEAARQPTRCIHWYAAMQTIAIAQNWPRAAYDDLFNQAIQLEPSYETTYFRKAHYLLAHGYGAPGEAAQFADEATRLHPGGMEIYARIVWSQIHAYSGDFFATSGYSWEKTKAGFEALLAATPQSAQNLQAYAYFACRVKDRDLARDLFKKIDGQEAIVSIWGNHGYFEQCRRWALWQKKQP